MKKITLLLVLVTALLGFQSCKHAATSGLIVPKDASMVAYIDGSSLTSKLSWEEIKQTAWFKKQYESDTDEYKKSLMNDPEASGINIKSDFVYFMKNESNGSYSSLEGKLKDAAAFETFTSKMDKNKKVEKDGDLNFIKMNESSTVIWNKSMFMVLSSSGHAFGKQTFMKGMQDMNSETTLSADTLVQIAKGLLNLSNDNLLNSDDRFTSLLKESGDIHFWVNNDQFGPGATNGMLSMFKAGDLVKGIVSATTLSFEKGKISISSKSYLSKQLVDFMKDHKPEPLNVDMISRIPFQNVSVVLATNVSPEGIVALLKMAGLDGIANAELAKSKLNLDDIVSAFKGQSILAVSDVTVTEKEQTVEGTQFTYKTKVPDANYFAGISVKNKASFQKFLDLGKDELDELTKTGKVSYKLGNDWFVVSNSTETEDKFLAGGNNHFPFTDKISGHPFGMYIDLQKLSSLSKMMGGVLDTTSSKDPVWQDVILTGGDFKDGAITSNVEINLFDKSTNSLKQVFDFGSNIFNRFSGKDDMINKKDQVDMNMQTDTSTMKTTDPTTLQSETDKKNPKK